MKASPALLVLTLLSAGADASPADLSFPPVSPAAHDFNHSPVGQSFTATASDVRAGIYLTDAGSFENWLASVYPGQFVPGTYPYAVAPTVSVRIELLAGEGTGGAVLYSETRTIAAPFSGFVEVDAGAAGVALSTGQQYTLMMTDVSAQAYPQGVTGWVVPACAYDGGHPVLQGAVVAGDSGTGDNCFQVLDNAVTGTGAVITAYVPRNPGFIVINGGINLLDHLWTNNLNPANTTFLDGLTNWYQTGLIVDYTGVATPQGVLLTSLTVKKAVTPLSIAVSSLTGGTQGVAYNCPVTVTVNGGVGPFDVNISGLPAGLTFDGVTVSGTPAAAGGFSPVITVADSRGTTAAATLTLSISSPPAAAAYTVREDSRGKITAVGSDYLMAGTRKLIWNAATSISVHTPSGELHSVTGFVKPGMKVQWKGLLDKSTGTVLTGKLEIN